MATTPYIPPGLPGLAVIRTGEAFINPFYELIKEDWIAFPTLDPLNWATTVVVPAGVDPTIASSTLSLIVETNRIIIEIVGDAIRYTSGLSGVDLDVSATLSPVFGTMETANKLDPSIKIADAFKSITTSEVTSEIVLSCFESMLKIIGSPLEDSLKTEEECAAIVKNINAVKDVMISDIDKYREASLLIKQWSTSIDIQDILKSGSSESIALISRITTPALRAACSPT